ncbi:MAG TPA: ABC transporter permease [Planctomycetes bacterium]|nr:ABC transporter permease [Planctomycetota bacterium]HIL36807.1 ABC transporter permease [Planctomycetota bacterium]
MSDPQQEPEGGVYSKDYWDLVFEQLGRRKLFRVGMGVLALLYGLVIFAPFLAGDRPFSFEGVDRAAYGSSLNSLRAVTNGMLKLVEQPDEAYLAELEQAGTLGRDGVPQSREKALVLEVDALELRLDVVALYLPDGASEERAALAAFREKAAAGRQAFGGGDTDLATALLGEAKDLTRELRKSLRPLDPKNPDRGGVALQSRRTLPLWDALWPREIFFMVLWVLLASWPVWNRLLNQIALKGDRERIRDWRRRKAALVLGLSVFASLGWYAAFGDGDDMYKNGPHKAGLISGAIVALPEGQLLGEGTGAFDPTWPPLTYGLAETHTEEMFRPPTWWWWAEIDEAGRYVRGPKSASEENTGFTAAVTPVDVRAGEPARNSKMRHLAGVDELGRDFLTRLVWGGRISLTVGILSALLLTIIGVVFGSIAGYFGGRIDVAIMRLIEILQAIPAFFLILMTMAFIPADVISPIFAIVIVIALIRWTGVARLVRGEFLRLREQEFVIAAQALGFSNQRTIFRHVLPNAMGPVLVSAAFAVAAGILTESAVSFLGFGIRPPEASWGSLVNESKNAANWWIQLFPGLLIFITVTCYNLVGDAVRDALDPKMKL